jgi:hypothetical protein
MMSSIHSLRVVRNTLFMASLLPGYHAPPNPIHYHILRLMTNPPMALCYPSASGQSVWLPASRLLKNAEFE